MGNSTPTKKNAQKLLDQKRSSQSGGTFDTLISPSIQSFINNIIKNKKWIFKDKLVNVGIDDQEEILGVYVETDKSEPYKFDILLCPRIWNYYPLQHQKAILLHEFLHIEYLDSQIITQNEQLSEKALIQYNRFEEYEADLYPAIEKLSHAHIMESYFRKMKLDEYEFAKKQRIKGFMLFSISSAALYMGYFSPLTKVFYLPAMLALLIKNVFPMHYPKTIVECHPSTIKRYNCTKMVRKLLEIEYAQKGLKGIRLNPQEPKEFNAHITRQVTAAVRDAGLSLDNTFPAS